MSANMHIFENASALAEALADDVGARLAAAIAARGTASLAVSGGSTPKAFSSRFPVAKSIGRK